MLKALPNLRFAVRSSREAADIHSRGGANACRRDRREYHALQLRQQCARQAFLTRIRMSSSPRIRTDEARGRIGNLSYPDFEDYREAVDQTGLFDLAVHDWEPYAIAGDGGAARVGGGAGLGEICSMSWVFSRFLVGRFLPEEEEPGATPVVILSEQLWRRQFRCGS